MPHFFFFCLAHKVNPFFSAENSFKNVIKRDCKKQAVTQFALDSTYTLDYSMLDISTCRIVQHATEKKKKKKEHNRLTTLFQHYHRQHKHNISPPRRHKGRSK